MEGYHQSWKYPTSISDLIPKSRIYWLIIKTVALAKPLLLIGSDSQMEESWMLDLPIPRMCLLPERRWSIAAMCRPIAHHSQIWTQMSQVWIHSRGMAWVPVSKSAIHLGHLKILLPQIDLSSDQGVSYHTKYAKAKHVSNQVLVAQRPASTSFTGPRISAFEPNVASNMFHHTSRGYER